VLSDHVDHIRDQFTRQAQAHANRAQAKDPDTHARLVALVGAKPTDRVLDVACGPDAAADAEIRRRFAGALERDGTGLEVRRNGAEIVFTHQTLVLIGPR
jgi:protein-L-isoaspartate O-methyltransferase